ncbi:Panacea domain-containing protein (plasmid) [Carnobacterium maltaromaticum]|uniref:Panacea domain-containing protein n=1 Tax=Carnobacterium maltaromaticum TaxID=2751 RepID=UPI00344B798E
MYKVEQIARWFIEQADRTSGEVITHLKLQKLVYYVQAWSLALFDEKVFEEDIQAWAHGPVSPVLYHQLKVHSYNALNEDVLQEFSSEFDEKTESLLREIKTIYGRYDAKHLEELTHQEKPWIETRNGLTSEERCEEIIPVELMASFYKEMQSNG